MVIVEKFKGNADLEEVGFVYLSSSGSKRGAGKRTLTRALWGSASFRAGSLKARTKVSTD